jgi:hypothetical protein
VKDLDSTPKGTQDPATKTTLRHQSTTLSGSGLKAALVWPSLFDKQFNCAGKGIHCDYRQQLVGDVVQIADRICGQLWQEGSAGSITLAAVKTRVAGLNPAHFAGYADWRLFTVEEGAVFWCRTLPVNVTLTSFLRVVATLSGPEMRLPVTAPG